MLKGLRTSAIHVADLAGARDWYARVLGFGPYFDEPYYVGFNVGGFELGIQPAEPGMVPGSGSASVLWAVDDVSRAIDALLALGAVRELDAGDVGGDIVVGTMLDPFGNRIGLIVNPHFRLSAAQAGGDAVRGPIAVVDAGARLGAAEGDLSACRIEHETVVSEPPAVAWTRWVSAEGLQWLVPEARVELRIGGAYELYFMSDAPPGVRGSEGCRVLSFVPERILSFTWNAPPHLAETRPQHTWVTVEFEAVDGGTRVRITHLGWPESGLADPESQWSATFAYFDRAWA